MPNKTPELAGQIVMVHPELTTDPVNMQGKIGVVTAVTPGTEVWVRFDAQSVGKYQANALLILYPIEIINQGLTTNFSSFSMEDLTAMGKILLLIELRQPKEALAQGMSNDNIRFFCVTDCADWMELHNGKKEQHQKRKGLK